MDVFNNKSVMHRVSAARCDNACLRMMLVILSLWLSPVSYSHGCSMGWATVFSKDRPANRLKAGSFDEAIVEYLDSQYGPRGWIFDETAYAIKGPDFPENESRIRLYLELKHPVPGLKSIEVISIVSRITGTMKNYPVPAYENDVRQQLEQVSLFYTSRSIASYHFKNYPLQRIVLDMKEHGAYEIRVYLVQKTKANGNHVTVSRYDNEKLLSHMCYNLVYLDGNWPEWLKEGYFYY